MLPFPSAHPVEVLVGKDAAAIWPVATAPSTKPGLFIECTLAVATLEEKEGEVERELKAMRR